MSWLAEADCDDAAALALALAVLDCKVGGSPLRAPHCAMRSSAPLVADTVLLVESVLFAE